MSDVMTVLDRPVASELVKNYFQNLVNRFFKILPMKENNEESLNTYIVGLQNELLGCKELLPEMKENAMFMSLLCLLQFLSDNPDTSTRAVKRIVFQEISTCQKLERLYSDVEVGL